jgi:hypothetical protein
MRDLVDVHYPNATLIRRASSGRFGMWLGTGPARFLYITQKSICFHGRSSHRIRHCALFAGTCRARNIERLGQALAASEGAPSVRAPGPDVRLKTLRLRAAARVAAAG